mmetsp:Transcript_11844/g.38938  ORF Transcript_11844/g.38938 Transcript_11844/m.38938 type:complete len:314 (-) Transcript_11844:2-943(-)
MTALEHRHHLLRQNAADGARHKDVTLDGGPVQAGDVRDVLASRDVGSGADDVVGEDAAASLLEKLRGGAANLARAMNDESLTTHPALRDERAKDAAKDAVASGGVGVRLDADAREHKRAQIVEVLHVSLRRVEVLPGVHRAFEMAERARRAVHKRLLVNLARIRGVHHQLRTAETRVVGAVLRRHAARKTDTFVNCSLLRAVRPEPAASVSWLRHLERPVVANVERNPAGPLELEHDGVILAVDDVRLLARGCLVRRGDVRHEQVPARRLRRAPPRRRAAAPHRERRSPRRQHRSSRASLSLPQTLVAGAGGV